MILSAADRRTLTNVARVVRSLGDTPLAQHFDAFVERITADPVPRGVSPFATSLRDSRLIDLHHDQLRHSPPSIGQG